MPDPESTPRPARKPRHDAFDGARRRAFLKALGKTGCVSDAARAAKVSRRTVYNHQEADRRFARQCELALDMASTSVELHAWERGVVGVEEPIVRGGEIVGTRLKRSDAILKLLLQGANRLKYGPNPGFTRRQLYKAERERIEREVRAEYRAREKPDAQKHAELVKVLDRRLAMVERQNARKRLAAGWHHVDGQWIPPGWTYSGAPAASAPTTPIIGGSPCELTPTWASVCKS